MSGPTPVPSSNTSPNTSLTSPGSARSGRYVGGSAAPFGGPSDQSSSCSPQSSRPAYVSPYPPLPPASSHSTTAQPIPAISSTYNIVQRDAPQSSSAASSVANEDNAENVREYTFPVAPLQSYQSLSFRTMLDARSITQAQKQALINALNEHRVNTIGELRRIERLFATLGSSDLTQPMTSAWMYYVNSNSLLTELRGLTRNYPFSSECLDEAKRRVHQDPASNRSWNYCWLVLAKVHTDRLISTYARVQASRPEMWGGRIPLAESVNQLAHAFEQEWTAALAQMLRYWESAPIR